uniref:Metalloendopeptidase n=1 Tax=Mola mola TaxID=94237 RepID=A0A3Q3X8X2_MOLML
HTFSFSLSNVFSLINVCKSNILKNLSQKLWWINLSRGCQWPKTGRYVYVPVAVSSSYSRAERNIIIRGLLTFHSRTCIRFVWRRLLWFVQCWSYIGRTGGKQKISLMRNGCVYKGIVQHEILHALGFHHEQARSDRDSYVDILYENIRSGATSNFNKRWTNNLGSSYNYRSVMHYGKYAFSKNRKPTIVAKRDPNTVLGSDQMSANDIDRVNKLYECCE